MKHEVAARGLLGTSVFIAGESVVTQDDEFGPIEGVAGLAIVRV